MPGNKPATTVAEFEPNDEVDLSRLDAMSETQIEAAAATDADNPPLTDDDMKRMIRVYTPDQIRALRVRAGLSRAAFARRFGLQARQLQDWEQGRKVPSASIHTLLRIIDREPDAVVRALAG